MNKSTSEHMKVLLIEDSPFYVELIQELLAADRDAVFEVEQSSRLSEGLDKLRTGCFDIVLLDLTLPDSEGLETFHDAYARSSGVPIVVMTGMDDEDLPYEAVKGGAQDYLLKGDMDGPTLVRSLRYALERARTANDPATLTEKVLFVDDEEALLATYERMFRKKCRISTASSGEEALGMIATHGPFAVVVSDSMMPGMDGAELLSRVEDLTPNTVRVMLTDKADLRAAIDAVNKGSIFRFLTKPCEPEIMESTLVDAIQQFRFIITYPGDNPNPVIQASRDGVIQYANRASAPLLSFWTCDVGQLLPLEVRSLASSCMNEGACKEIEIALSGRTYALNLAPIVETGNVNLYATDVTARRHAEEQTRQLAEELERSNKELENFAYVASHDLQEPLRMITSYTQLLEKKYRDELDDEALEFIGYAVEAAQRMRLLIRDLLEFSRAGRNLDLGPTDAAEVLTDVLTGIQLSIAESGATVTQDELPTVTSHPLRLGQVFHNLISNALKFRREEPPRIHIGAKRKAAEWVFSVRDNGIGIPQDAHDRIFIMLQRLNTRSEYPGTGIGLAICKRVVENCGGRIWVESEVGKGSTLFFTLPKAEVLQAT